MSADSLISMETLKHDFTVHEKVPRAICNKSGFFVYAANDAVLKTAAGSTALVFASLQSLAKKLRANGIPKFYVDTTDDMPQRKKKRKTNTKTAKTSAAKKATATAKS